MDEHQTVDKGMAIIATQNFLLPLNTTEPNILIFVGRKQWMHILIANKKMVCDFFFPSFSINYYDLYLF